MMVETTKDARANAAARQLTIQQLVPIAAMAANAGFSSVITLIAFMNAWPAAQLLGLFCTGLMVLTVAREMALLVRREELLIRWHRRDALDLNYDDTIEAIATITCAEFSKSCIRFENLHDEDQALYRAHAAKVLDVVATKGAACVK